MKHGCWFALSLVLATNAACSSGTDPEGSQDPEVPGAVGGSAGTGGAQVGGAGGTGAAAGTSPVVTGGAPPAVGGSSGESGSAGAPPNTGGTPPLTGGTAGSTATGGGGGVTDECDTTAECQARYGSQATDCVDSQSDQSWCACGDMPCSDPPAGGAGGTGGTGGTASGGTPGTVLWYGDPDLAVRDVFRRLDPDGNSDPTGDQCVDDPNNPPEVSTPTDPVYGKHWRIHKPPSRKRAEFARTNGFIPQDGGDYYVGWRWRITSSPPLSDGIAVFQWKTDPGDGTYPNTQNYPFNFGYDGSELSLNAYGPGDPDWTEGSSISNRRTTIWRHPVALDTWVELVLRVKVSRDPTVGFIELWFNGQQQTLMNSNVIEYQVVLANNQTRAYHKTLDGSQVYKKWGAYNENACDYDITVDFDDMRVGTTYEVARPR